MNNEELMIRAFLMFFGGNTLMIITIIITIIITTSISVVRWATPLAAVSPSSECLYEGKADVVYLQVILCDPHLSA